ncbi:DUF2922 domain-containing protein [Lysinibacillus sp. 54212]|uniref:DUF2922 domain-containing protein n=1 Tax=Lysinibacillus sp. 54212 TaxID=3119829 RepID=UPI002FC6CDE8
MTKVLELVFELTGGKTLTLSINNPSTSLTDEMVNSTMQTIIAQNIFEREGQSIVGKKSARLVDRVVTPFTMS